MIFIISFFTTDERTSANALHPVMLAADLKDTQAFTAYCSDFGRPKKVGRGMRREKLGDFLHGKPTALLVGENEPVVACFKALFQGDHLGVDFACDAHARMLWQGGLLEDGFRLQSDRAIVGDSIVGGLVIDDFFTVSRENVNVSADDVYPRSASERQFRIAKTIYEKEGILGSDDKDVVASPVFKACGGEVVSTAKAVASGVVSLAVPYQKRVALSALTMTASSWKFTTDALHSCLVGSWVSSVLLRRPAIAALNEVFKVIPPEQLSPEEPCLRFLPRKAAEELQLMAALSMVMVSNLAVPFSTEIGATDASTEKGGVCVAKVTEDIAGALWRTAEKKKSPVSMTTSAQAILQAYDSMYEPTSNDTLEGSQFDRLFGAGVSPEDSGQVTTESCQRPIGMRFQFIELCGGAGGLTYELAHRGISCGPVLDLSLSQQYNLAEHRVLQWVAFMLEEGRLDSFLVSPPCASFSPAAFPSVRSYKQPRGYDQSLEKVIGNLLAFAAIFCLFVALRMKKFGLGEQPRRSKMRWLDEWRRLLQLGAREVFLASCMYGSVHQKEFCFVGVNMVVSPLQRRCSRDHDHLKIQGKFTKPSATYCPGLVQALATLFVDHFKALGRAESRYELRTNGLEDALTNDIAVLGEWKATSSWKWLGKSHINVLEVAACVKFLRDLARAGGDLRCTVFLDSHVALSCLVRGRSSATSLQGLLKKAAALCIAYGLYPAFRFVPTRSNPADAPSRSCEVDAPVPNSVSADSGVFLLRALAMISGTKRWASNWIRLVLLISPSVLFLLSCADARKHAPSFINLHEWTLDFDSTLGYPGEGPGFLFLTLFLGVLCSSLDFALGVGVDPSHGDLFRKAKRAGVVLEDGRRVTETTANVRGVLFVNFCSWLRERDLVFDEIFLASPPDLDYVNKILVQYGRWLFAEGKPYYHFSECINLVASKRPILRRSMQQAWDLCFLWGSHEPVEHHVAMPYQILIALISAAWWWGWDREAAVFALSWGALLRIGEILQARRADLILPSDVQGTNPFALLRIREPKTRFRAARHQSGRLEHADLLEVVRIGFLRLAPHEKLWPWSGATLRSRLTRLLRQLGLPTELNQSPKPLSLASFRPGGATHMISICDNAEAVRRRGRWASFRVMEIYLQEVSSATYLQCKLNVLTGLKIFPALLRRIHALFECKIPANTWFLLLKEAARDSPKVQNGQTGGCKDNKHPSNQPHGKS